MRILSSYSFNKCSIDIFINRSWHHRTQEKNFLNVMKILFIIRQTHHSIHFTDTTYSTIHVFPVRKQWNILLTSFIWVHVAFQSNSILVDGWYEQLVNMKSCPQPIINVYRSKRPQGISAECQPPACPQFDRHIEQVGGGGWGGAVYWGPS